MIPAGSITLANQQGESQWIVTDDEGYILGLPPMPGVVNFDPPGPGTCLIWHLSYDGEVSGLAPGLNAADIAGDCFSLSNSIEVIRLSADGCQANAGELFGGPFGFYTIGDDEPDMLAPGAITLANQQGESQWIVTDDQGNILGLPPMPSVVDFDGAGEGTCFVYHLSYIGEVSGVEAGANIDNISGDCFGISNAVTVNRFECDAEAATLTGGPFSFTEIGDGVADMIPEGSITVDGGVGETQWIVTDDEGYILGLPPMPSVVNFDGAGAGTCFIWHASIFGDVVGLAPGMLATQVEGCFALSNSIMVTRENADGCQANAGELFGGPFTFTEIGDGEADMIPGGAITIANEQGENAQWVITDSNGNILGLPPSPFIVNFDVAGAGTCFVYNVSWDGEITGLNVSQNISNLEGCFGISNSVTVYRENASGCNANGGELFGGPFTFDSVGDGVADMIPAGSITLANQSGEGFQWIVTDDEGYILGLPPMPSAVNFDGAGPGTCFIWYLAYEGEISGLEVGMSANEIEGCHSLSNSITIIREAEGDCQVNGGELFGGPFTFNEVGDGTPDMIPEGSITVANQQGDNTQWIVTDDEGYILGLPPMPSVVDFDTPGAGTCLIWLLTYEGQISDLAPGVNASDITGDCFALSNSISVIRENADGCNANGGELFGGPFTFTEVGDGTPDMIPAGSITLANEQGENRQWVVTDDEGYILGLPPMPSVVDFDTPGAGTCLIWNLSYVGEISGLEVGMSALEIEGCFSLSNSIEVIRENADGCQANAGELFGGPFTFTEVGDGTPDMIPAGAITLANQQGDSQWIVTDDEGYILGLPPMPSVVDFDTPGAGTCLIWHLSSIGEVSGVEVGLSAFDISGDCFGLSNSIAVIRENADGCQVNGGELFGGPFTFNEVGDGTPDMIPAGSITVANQQGDNTQWIVTDDEGYILGLPPMPSVVDFDTPGAGTCLIWLLTYEGEISELTVGMNAADISGDCFGLSNSVSVIRENASGCNANGGELFGGPFTFTEVGDGTPDMIPAGSITLVNEQGENRQWVVTDDQGYILGLPPMPSAVDFDTPGAGTCLIWNLSYDGAITGLEVGNLASEVEGCFSLSNSITVIRENASGCNANGGELFGGPFTFDVGDGAADNIPAGSITLANQNGDAQWVITDENAIIIALPAMPSDFDFDNSAPGTCFVWNLSFEGDVVGAEVGMDATQIEGCHSLSNSIEVTKLGCIAEGGTVTAEPFQFCVNDNFSDTIDPADISLDGNVGANSNWLVTTADGVILDFNANVGDIDFNTQAPGECFIWNISYEDGITGLEAGANVSDLGGCFAISNSIAVTKAGDGEICVTSTDEEELFEDLRVYPNPNTGEFNVEYATTANFRSGTIEIRNQVGQLIQTNLFQGGNNTIQIDLTNHPTGTYLVTIKSENLVVNRRVIVVQ